MEKCVIIMLILMTGVIYPNIQEDSRQYRDNVLYPTIGDDKDCCDYISGLYVSTGGDIINGDLTVNGNITAYWLEGNISYSFIIGELWGLNISNLWVNASSQQSEIDGLWLNASGQQSQIDSISSTQSFLWLDSNGYITSNNTVNNGRVNISSNISVKDDIINYGVYHGTGTYIDPDQEYLLISGNQSLNWDTRLLNPFNGTSAGFITKLGDEEKVVFGTIDVTPLINALLEESLPDYSVLRPTFYVITDSSDLIGGGVTILFKNDSGSIFGSTDLNKGSLLLGCDDSFFYPIAGDEFTIYGDSNNNHAFRIYSEHNYNIEVGHGGLAVTPDLFFNNTNGDTTFFIDGKTGGFYSNSSLSLNTDGINSLFELFVDGSTNITGSVYADSFFGTLDAYNIINEAWTGNISNLWDNASNQQSLIDDLYSNASNQQSLINDLYGNASNQQTLIDDLYSNASNQQTLIDDLYGNASNQQLLIDDLYSNASNQQTLIDGIKTHSTYWIDENGYITSNNTVNNGRVNVSTNLTVTNDFQVNGYVLFNTTKFGNSNDYCQIQDSDLAGVVTIPVISCVSNELGHALPTLDLMAIIDGDNDDTLELTGVKKDLSNGASIYWNFTSNSFMFNWGLFPQEDNSFNLGHSSYRWKSGVFSDSLTAGSGSFSGHVSSDTLTVNETIQLGSPMDNMMQLGWDSSKIYFSTQNEEIVFQPTGGGSDTIGFDFSSGDKTIYTGDDNLILKPADNLVFQPNGDTDDYLVFNTTGNMVVFNRIGGANTRFKSDVANTAIELMSNDNVQAVIGKFNATDANYPSDLRLYNPDADGEIVLMPNGDTNDYVIISTASNVVSITPNTDGEGTLGTDALTWADVKSVLINGADYCFENNMCLTECLDNNSNPDICIVKGKPTGEQFKSILTASFKDYQEYVNKHMVNKILLNGTVTDEMVFDNSLSKEEFEFYRSKAVFKDGKDFTLGREKVSSFNHIKDLELKATRYDILINILEDERVVTDLNDKINARLGLNA